MRRRCLTLLCACSVLSLPLQVARSADDPVFAKWLLPLDWRRDSDKPVLSLGAKGNFDDQHIFAPHVIHWNGEYWMYYSGSQRCVDAGTYKGVPKDPKQPAKSDQRSSNSA